MFASLGYLICIPFAWLLKIFYNLTGSYGVAIILFTLAIKFILLPFQIKSKKSMLRMSRMSGKMQELQKKYANNQAKLNEELQKLYQEEGVNPMSGCLWSFLPLPILIALYSIIRQPITHFMMLSEEVVQGLVAEINADGMSLDKIVQMRDNAAVIKDGIYQLQPYGQINLVRMIESSAPEMAEGIEGWFNMNYNFLGLDLTVHPWDIKNEFSLSWAVIGLLLIPVLAGLFQLFMSMYTMRSQAKDNPSAGSMKGMMYMMPMMTVYFGFIMPAALGVYWIAQSVFSLVQEIFMTKFLNKRLEAEENARYEAMQADRQRRMEEGRQKQAAIQKQMEQKPTLREKQQAAQTAKAGKAAKAKSSTTEEGRVGNRPYARGRAYQADRYQETK